MTHEYATINEIQESEERRSKKQKSRALKSIQNALKRPLRRRKLSQENKRREDIEFGEMGYKPTHKSNPLSKLMQGSGGGKGEKKISTTPTTPPPTPATYSSENSKPVK